MSKQALQTNGKKIYNSINGAGAFHSSQEGNKMKLGLCHTVYRKINPQWDNLKGKIIIEGDIRRYLYDCRVRRNLLNHKEKA